MGNYTATLTPVNRYTAAGIGGREPTRRNYIKTDEGDDVGMYGGIGAYTETEKAAMDATKGPSEYCRSGAVPIRSTSLEPTPSGPHMINHACANTVDTRFNHE
jgi:hypothetical protein